MGKVGESLYIFSSLALLNRRELDGYNTVLFMTALSFAQPEQVCNNNKWLCYSDKAPVAFLWLIKPVPSRMDLDGSHHYGLNLNEL